MTRIVAALAEAISGERAVAGPNLATGFHAAAVDVGRLQAALELGVARLDAEQREARWEELSAWMRAVLRAWVQRIKMLRLMRAPNGVRVEIQTQDDLGYYDYAFDALDRRRRSPRSGDAQ